MSTCRWTATDQPRALAGHHTDDCDRDACTGCQPCTRSHCVGDACRGRNHADTICAECITAARDDLAAIVEMADFQLLEEVLLRGSVTGEAAMMLGPSANPEAWRYRATSALVGRTDAAYLDDCRDELHPLWVLGTWENIWRDALDQQSDLRQTVRRASDYLTVQMHVMANRTDPPFDEFAQELRQCRAHLEAVLHDEAKGDPANVGCFECGGRLEKRLTDTGFDDVWSCRGCRRRYTYAEYNFAFRAALEPTA